MLAERLNEVALDVSRFAEANDVVKLLDEVHSGVVAVEKGRSPGESQSGQEQSDQSGDETSPEEQRKRAQQKLNAKLSELRGILRSAPSNDFSPSEEAILKAMNGWSLTGDRLWDEVQVVLERPAFEEVDVADHLEDLIGDAKNFYDGLDQLLSGFDTLGIDRSTLPGDSAEIGFLFPVEMGQATLEDLYSDLDELETHLRFFAETVGETPGVVRVRAISSSGWQLFLESPYAQAGLVLFAVNECLRIIDRGLDVAQKWRDLRDSGTSEEVTDERIEEDVQATTENEADELVEELLKKYQGDEGRRNELRTGLRNAVEYIIKQLRRGTKFQVRVVTSPTDPDDDEEEIYPGLGTLSELKDLGILMSETRSEERKLGEGEVELLPESTGAIEEEGDEEGDEEEEPKGPTDETNHEEEVGHGSGPEQETDATYGRSEENDPDENRGG